MTKTTWIIVAGLLAVLCLSTAVSLNYRYALILFGGLALLSAYPLIHKTTSGQISSGLLVGLAIFASLPAKRILGAEGFATEAVVTLVYLGVLFVAGMGWRRRWT